jgi:hypothetical protein
MKTEIFRWVGDFQLKVLMHPDRLGYVLFEAENRNEALALVEQAMSKLEIEVKV